MSTCTGRGSQAGTMSTRCTTCPASGQGPAQLADRPLRRRFRRARATVTGHDVEALREEIARVLATMGSPVARPKPGWCTCSDGFDFLGFRIQWRRKRGTNKWHVYTFIADRPIRSLKAKDPCPDEQDVTAAPGSRADPARSDHARMVNYFRHAVGKHTFSTLAHFAWWRVARWLMALHHWKWNDFRRRSTGPAGRWQPLSADGKDLFNLEAVPVTRYRYRGNIPTPWALLCHLTAGNRGEPGAPRGARRVRRAAWGNGPGAIRTPRPRPTQLQHQLQPDHLPGPIPHQLDSIAGQHPQPTNLRRRHEPGPQQPVLQQLRDPLRVTDITLAARHCLHGSQLPNRVPSGSRRRRCSASTRLAAGRFAAISDSAVSSGVSALVEGRK